MKYQYAVGRVWDHFPELTAEHITTVLQRSTFVNIQKRYMSFRVPKAAATQMAELLRAVENAPPLKLFVDGSWETRRDMFVNAHSNVPLPSLVDLDNRTQREVLEAADFLRMTVVRNPYTRLVSAWKNKVLLCEPSVKGDYLQIKGRLPGFHEKSLVSFAEFVEHVRTKCDLRTCDAHWRRQVDHTFLPAMNFSYVGKLEKFGEVLRRFKRHLGVSESLVADGRNESISFGPNPYTQELADKVYALYQSDFEVFGYDRNTWAVSRQNSPKASTNSGVSVERFIDEIVERNLIISSLYEECDRLKAQLPGVSPLGLARAIDGLMALQSFSGRAHRKVRRMARLALRPRRQMGAERVSVPVRAD